MSISLTQRLGDLSGPPLVMGIVNVTPDSFSDGGLFVDSETAIAHGRALLAAGADILDIGGESTRPGAGEVSVCDEIERVLPVIAGLAAAGADISVDTSKPEVMRAAVEAGAIMINDVNALKTPGAMDYVAGLALPVCLMHRQGRPRTMQTDPVYTDVVTEVRDDLLARVADCVEAGILRERLLIDPGFGFGKTVTHNLQMLHGLGHFVATGQPVMVGLSRKSMLQSVTGRVVRDRLWGSLALATLAVWQGARVLRVHDVAATVDAVKVAHAVRSVVPPQVGQ